MRRAPSRREARLHACARPAAGASACRNAVTGTAFRSGVTDTQHFRKGRPGCRERRIGAEKRVMRHRNRTFDGAQSIAQTKFADQSNSKQFERFARFERQPIFDPPRRRSREPIARSATRFSASRWFADGASVALVKRSVTNRARCTNQTRPQGSWFEYCCIECEITCRVHCHAAKQTV